MCTSPEKDHTNQLCTSCTHNTPTFSPHDSLKLSRKKVFKGATLSNTKDFQFLLSGCYLLFCHKLCWRNFFSSHFSLEGIMILRVWIWMAPGIRFEDFSNNKWLFNMMWQEVNEQKRNVRNQTTYSNAKAQTLKIYREHFLNKRFRSTHHAFISIPQPVTTYLLFTVFEVWSH